MEGQRTWIIGTDFCLKWKSYIKLLSPLLNLFLADVWWTRKFPLLLAGISTIRRNFCKKFWHQRVKYDSKYAFMIIHLIVSIYDTEMLVICKIIFVQLCKIPAEHGKNPFCKCVELLGRYLCFHAKIHTY